MKHKVDIDNVPDKYKYLVKEEMTNDEIAILGTIIMKDKLSNFKQKLLWWKHDRKTKKHNK